MATLAPRRRLGAISYRAARGAFEIRLREHRGGPHVTTYLRGHDTPAGWARAEEALAERIAALGRGERHTGRNLTVGAWLDQWAELQLHLRPATRRAYENRIRLYLKPVLGRHKLWELEGPDVTRAMARLAGSKGERTPNGLHPGTVASAFRVLSAALEDAHRERKAPWNACRTANVPRSQTHIEPPSQAELDRLFEVMGDHPYRAILSVMRWTGARHGEVLGIRWRDLKESGVLELVKQASGGPLKTRRSVRSVVLPPTVEAELHRIPRRVDTDLVFTDELGRPITERRVLHAFDALLERARIAPHPEADLDKYRPHDLRHAFATMLLEAGVERFTVSGWLGHTSIAMLDRYGHVRTIHDGDAYRRMAAAWGDLTLFGLRSPERRRAAAR